MLIWHLWFTSPDFWLSSVLAVKHATQWRHAAQLVIHNDNMLSRSSLQPESGCYTLMIVQRSTVYNLEQKEAERGHDKLIIFSLILKSFKRNWSPFPALPLLLESSEAAKFLTKRFVLILLLWFILLKRLWLQELSGKCLTQDNYVITFVVVA